MIGPRRALAAVAVAVVALVVAGCATPGPRSQGPDPVPTGPGALPPVVATNGIIRLDRDARGIERPRPEDEGCVGRALMWQKAARGVENRVKFAVLRDGSLARFSFEKPIGDEAARAVETAFRSCAWVPGKDPDGRPVAVWVIQPFKVNPPPGS